MNWFYHDLLLVRIGAASLLLGIAFALTFSKVKQLVVVILGTVVGVTLLSLHDAEGLWTIVCADVASLSLIQLGYFTSAVILNLVLQRQQSKG